MRKNLIRLYKLLLVTFITLDLALAVVIGWDPVKAKLQDPETIAAVKETIDLATTKKPETLTELYFENHASLPKTIERHTNYSFTFTIHNLEYKAMQYPYVVYLEANNKKIVLDEGLVSLKDGGYTSITEEFGPLKLVRMKITVELAGRNQPISFWMEADTEL
jgi:hypothetical protein